MNPIDYRVGQRIVVTAANLDAIRNSNRSIHAYPSDSYVASVTDLVNKSVAGTISRRFTPGYEFNVDFDNGLVMQMKDHWVTPLTNYDPVDFF